MKQLKPRQNSTALNEADALRQAPVPTSDTLDLQLRKRYGPRRNGSFDLDVQLTAAPGVNVLIGHSGAGKTTLLRCIAGLCDADEGRIAIGDRELFDATRGVSVEPARRKVGFVFQDLALFPHLLVQDNIGYGLRLLEASDRERRIDSILQSFKIAHLRKRLPREISGGEQQRVALARSLVVEPSVLLLDEPLSSLDRRTKSEIIEDLRRWNERHRIPVLYVTHDESEALAFGGRVLTIEQGKIVDDSPHRAMRALKREQPIASAGFENVLDATVKELDGHKQTMVCRLAKGLGEVEVDVPPQGVEAGARVRLCISSIDILLASARPQLLSACNVFKGNVKRIDQTAEGPEAVLDCGVELRVRLSPQAAASKAPEAGEEAWVVVGPRSCHLIRHSIPIPFRRVFVFVCSGNTSRSPMAEAICRAEIAKRLKIDVDLLGELGIEAVSAGLSAKPGAPITLEALHALRQVGVGDVNHRSQNLDLPLAEQAEAIFCMTEDQRQAAMAMFPAAKFKIYRLDENGDIADPTGKGPEAFLNLAQHLSARIGRRLANLELRAA